MVKTLIIDDEPLALDILEAHIAMMPELELVGRCANALEATDMLQRQPVDLILLDIQMPQISGIEFIKSLEMHKMFIFTTAHSTYALDGFELDAIDYLLKPISFERFVKAIQKVLSRHELRLRERISPDHPGGFPDTEDFFFVKADKKMVRIKYDEILYIEGLKDYVIIRLEQGRVITLQTMKSLEDKLPPAKFIRIHRSFIVAVAKIHAVEGTVVDVFEKGVLKQLPIGKNHRETIIELVHRNKL